MTFIHSKTCWPGWSGVFRLVDFLLRWVPKVLTICDAFIARRLQDIRGPWGHFVLTIHQHSHFLEMLNGAIPTRIGRNNNLPLSKFLSNKRMRSFVPVVEFASQVQVTCTWRPLQPYYRTILLHLTSKLFMPKRKVFQTTFILVNARVKLLEDFIATLNLLLMIFKVRIKFKQFVYVRHHNIITVSLLFHWIRTQLIGHKGHCRGHGLCVIRVSPFTSIQRLSVRG